jgi:photosystem II stability/assembly factor-like uncharacterized protein
MSFAGASGYAAGDFGTLLHTADGGSSWAGLRSGTLTDLTDAEAIDADSLFAGGGCVARRSDDAGATFKRVAFTPVESSCREQLAAGWFVNEQIGFLALTDGTVLRTDNDGDSFAQKTPLPGTPATRGTATPTDVTFVDDQAGVGATSDGRIFRTTDGANSWTEVSATDRAVRALLFVDPSHGFAVGDGALFLATRDGGATWTPRDLGLPGTDLRSISCAALALCVMTTGRGDAIVRTSDEGASAKLISPSPDPIYAAGFASPARIPAGGATGATAVSDDGGLNFTPVGGRLSGTYARVRAGDQPGTAFAPGDNGSLAKSVDGGRTWTRGNVSTSEDVADVAFPTAPMGYALDAAGGLFRTTDGGATWRTLDTGTTARPLAVVAPSSATVILVGPTGMRRSTDGGETFAAVGGKPVVKAKLSGVDRARGALFAYGRRDLLRSRDRGRTWTAVHKPGRLAEADFLDARRGYFLAEGGAVYRTTNGGRRWTQLLGVGTSGAYGMSFSSRTRGYLVIDRFGATPGRAGSLLRTSDAGATWRPQLVVSTPIAGGGVAATPGGTDYLLGGGSSLLFSASGGDSGRASALSIATRRRRLGRPAGVIVTGRLSPAAGNRLVTVSYLAPGSRGWRAQTVRTAANGSYTTSWRLRRGTNRFVAQWAGDFRSRGDGSGVLSVRVG